MSSFVARAFVPPMLILEGAGTAIGSVGRGQDSGIDDIINAPACTIEGSRVALRAGELGGAVPAVCHCKQEGAGPVRDRDSLIAGRGVGRGGVLDDRHRVADRRALLDDLASAL